MVDWGVWVEVRKGSDTRTYRPQLKRLCVFVYISCMTTPIKAARVENCEYD